MVRYKEKLLDLQSTCNRGKGQILSVHGIKCRGEPIQADYEQLKNKAGLELLTLLLS